MSSHKWVMKLIDWLIGAFILFINKLNLNYKTHFKNIKDRWNRISRQIKDSKSIVNSERFLIKSSSMYKKNLKSINFFYKKRTVYKMLLIFKKQCYLFTTKIYSRISRIEKISPKNGPNWKLFFFFKLIK